VGGLWVLELADLDEALAWWRKAVVACRAPVEVRPFHGRKSQGEKEREVPQSAAAECPLPNLLLRPEKVQ
jgi:hypothetical protein